MIVVITKPESASTILYFFFLLENKLEVKKIEHLNEMKSEKPCELNTTLLSIKLSRLHLVTTRYQYTVDLQP